MVVSNKKNKGARAIAAAEGVSFVWCFVIQEPEYLEYRVVFVNRTIFRSIFFTKFFVLGFGRVLLRKCR